MRIIDSGKIQELAQFVSKHKYNYADWKFFCAQILEGETTPKDLFAILERSVSSNNVWVLKSKDALLVLAHAKDSLGLGHFEKALSAQFHKNEINITARSLGNDGIIQFADILRASGDNLSAQCTLSINRMARAGNNVMVLDDDMMVLKQMEKILSTFADVTALQTSEGFFDRYVDCAPDVLFLDIHLGAEKGSEILRKLKSKIDPSAYVIMISSDTQEETILDIRSAGVDGFLVKPINKNRIYHWMMQSPTANIYRKED